MQSGEPVASCIPLSLFDTQSDFAQTFYHAFDDPFKLDVVPD